MTIEPTSGARHDVRTSLSLHVRLDVMMFLQYFVQGAYLPVLSVYLQTGLGYSPYEMGIFTAAMSIGPFVAPFIIGQLIDRHFASQYVLAGCHFLSGGLMLVLYFLVKSASVPFALIVTLAALYSALYIPSMMVSNSLTFHHLTNRERDFPWVRLFGTIGFVIPAWLVELVFLRGLEGNELNLARGIVLALSGISGIVMGFYSLSLPHTPAPESEKNDLAPGKVLSLLRNRNFLVLVAISLVLAVAHKFFFFWNSPYLSDFMSKFGYKGAYEQRISSIGQICEVLVMIGLGFYLKRWGFKNTILIGATAYVARCLILAYAITFDEAFRVAVSFVCLGQALHGVCFACFLATAYIYVDRIAPPDVRGSMQTFYGTFIISLGFLIGSFISGSVGDTFSTKPVTIDAETDIDAATPKLAIRKSFGIDSDAGVTRSIQNKPDGGQEFFYRDWPGIWLSGAILAAIGLFGMALFFPKQEPDDAGEFQTV